MRPDTLALLVASAAAFGLGLVIDHRVRSIGRAAADPLRWVGAPSAVTAVPLGFLSGFWEMAGPNGGGGGSVLGAVAVVATFIAWFPFGLPVVKRAAGARWTWTGFLGILYPIVLFALLWSQIDLIYF